VTVCTETTTLPFAAVEVDWVVNVVRGGVKIDRGVVVVLLLLLVSGGGVDTEVSGGGVFWHEVPNNVASCVATTSTVVITGTCTVVVEPGITVKTVDAGWVQVPLGPALQETTVTMLVVGGAVETLVENVVDKLPEVDTSVLVKVGKVTQEAMVQRKLSNTVQRI